MMAGALKLLQMLRAAAQRHFQTGKEYADKLPSEDAKFIRAYVAEPWNRTTDVDDRSLLHSIELNEDLRSGIEPDVARFIDSILQRAPRADEPYILYRGIDDPDYPLVDKGFMSVSTNPEEASGYGHVRSLIMPQSTPLLSPDIDSIFDQDEMLLPRGLQMAKSPRGALSQFKAFSPERDTFFIERMPYCRGGLVR